MDTLTVIGLAGACAAGAAWHWYRSPRRAESEEVPSDLSIRAYVANTNRRCPQD